MMKIPKIDPVDAFDKTARKMPNKARKPLVFLVWLVVAGLPILSISFAAAFSAARVAAKICVVSEDHSIVVAFAFCVGVATLRLMIPIGKRLGQKLFGWSHEIYLETWR